jgi:hypothetical protein
MASQVLSRRESPDLARCCRSTVSARRTRSEDKRIQRQMPYDGRKYPVADARCAFKVGICVSGLLDEVAKTFSVEADAACRSEIDNAESNGMRHRVGAANHVELVDDRSDVKLSRMDRNRAPPRDRFVRRAVAEQHQRRPATGPSESTDAQGFTSGSSIVESISPQRSECHGPPSRDTTPSAPSPAVRRSGCGSHEPRRRVGATWILRRFGRIRPETASTSRQIA